MNMKRTKENVTKSRWVFLVGFTGTMLLLISGFSGITTAHPTDSEGGEPSVENHNSGHCVKTATLFLGVGTVQPLDDMICENMRMEPGDRLRGRLDLTTDVSTVGIPTGHGQLGVYTHQLPLRCNTGLAGVCQQTSGTVPSNSLVFGMCVGSDFTLVNPGTVAVTARLVCEVV